MKLSVVIVNYNTRNFIQLCLHSVLQACENLTAEVIVVDNHSSDDSCAVIKEKFPQVRLITNNENQGFARANNLGIAQAKGEYVLILNPDTVVPENCFIDCVEYLDENPNYGALGTKMVDGSGLYLRESKRGLPTPQTAFYKMSGLYKLFPKSEKIARYYHGNLGDDEINHVEVLTGAFFMARKTMGDQLGWFDEDYFMYGEDIDLSYRFTQAGFPLVYFPKASIVHFKGESSKNIDGDYIRNFFGTMEQFYQKHFSNNYGRLFKVVVTAGIQLKSALTVALKAFGNTKVRETNWSRLNLVWAKHNTTVKRVSDIIQKPVEKIDETKLGQEGANVIFTTEYTYQAQLQWMQTHANNKHQFIFLSPDQSFLISSPSRKWNGSVLFFKP